MRCHVCNAEVGDHQRFCHECGESLSGVTDPTEALDMQSVFESADAEGGTVTGALAWSDDDDAPSTEGSADAEGAALDAADEPADTDGAPPHPADALAPTAAVTLLAGDAAEQAVADAADPLPDPGTPTDGLWATPTAEPVPLPDPAAPTALQSQPPDPYDAAATTTLAATPPPGSATTAEYDEFTDPGATGQVLFDAADDLAPFPVDEPGFRFRLTLVLGVLAVLTAVLATLADVTDVRTDRVVPGIDNRLRTLDDIGSNLSIAVFIGAGLLLIGGLMHCFNLRWGAGLAGGAGLAIAGWAAVTIGLAEVPISVAERITRDPNTPGPFILTVTRDLGYWLIVAIGVLGLLAFLLSLVSAGSGGRPGLDPWTAAVGALGGVIAAAGPLVPVANATFSTNFGVNELPTAFFAGRLVQVGLLGLSVMVGFLLVRRYGLGLAAGGLSIPAFLWLTTLLDVGNAPIGVGVGNLGTADITPHAVTTVGMVVALLMLLVSAALAAIRRQP